MGKIAAQSRELQAGLKEEAFLHWQGNGLMPFSLGWLGTLHCNSTLYADSSESEADEMLFCLCYSSVSKTLPNLACPQAFLPKLKTCLHT